MIATIEIPPLVASGDLLVVASVSGGKDSTAMMLALREAGIPFRAVFADTQWEAPETYAYLDTLRERLGIPIDVVGVEGGMMAVADRKAGFPMRLGRWCTETLKLKPLAAYAEALGRETVFAVGVRAEESAKRAAMPAWEDEPSMGFVWRPILHWTIGDVLAAHHRHDVPMNPLYLAGHDRVGCYPCILATKGEIALVAAHAPGRIAQIRDAEARHTAERARRNASGEGRFAYPEATFFSARDGARGDIDTVIAWARTDRGGRQLPLLAEPPSGGCMRWGLCEPPPKEAA